MEMRDLLKKEFHLEEEPDTFECTRDSQQDNKNYWKKRGLLKYEHVRVVEWFQQTGTKKWSCELRNYEDATRNRDCGLSAVFSSPGESNRKQGHV